MRSALHKVGSIFVPAPAQNIEAYDSVQAVSGRFFRTTVEVKKRTSKYSSMKMATTHWALSQYSQAENDLSAKRPVLIF